MLLSEGARVAADGWLLQANKLQMDESLLTGESVAVDKHPFEPLPGRDLSIKPPTTSCVHGGTFVVRGSGQLRVTATGMRSQIGQIGLALIQVHEADTPLQQQTARLVRVLASLVGVLCVVMVLTLGWRTGQWVPALLSGIALAMAILPEEYSVVLTLFPAMGARRLTREGVLTRHINAIETLGAISVLCTDKTGTLTQNRMTVTALAVPVTVGSAEPGNTLRWHTPAPGQATASPTLARPLPEAFPPLIEHAILASAPTPFDPMETGFHAMGQHHLNGGHRAFGEGQLMQTLALSPSLKAMSHVWQFAADEPQVVSAKGAPEAIMDLCHLSQNARQHWLACVADMARQGLRVLAVAHSRFEGQSYPDTPHDFDFVWLGLIGLTDPLRPEIPQAVADCQSAGIQVIVITGDFAATAQEIARQAGLPDGQTLTGEAMEALDDRALGERLRQVTVCARISPHQKLRIVQALQAQGQVVAMTGDGVNDVPALKAAHVGIAMGAGGTDVAREAADLVLVDDNFASIVRGIRLGRRIFGNLQKSMQYIFAIHIPIGGMALIPMLMGWPAVMLPLHVALLELVIDPTCAIAFENEPEDASLMQKPPRNTSENLLGWMSIGLALGQGLVLTCFLAVTYLFAKYHALNQGQTRSMLFATLVVANTALFFAIRTRGRNGYELWRPVNLPAYALLLTAVGVVIAAIYWPLLHMPLQWAPLTGFALATSVGLGLASLPGVLLVQRVFSKEITPHKNKSACKVE